MSYEEHFDMTLLKENFIIDLKKKQIDPFARAAIIRSYMETKGLSGRELARQMGIPHSTVQDWLLWKDIDDKKYEELKSAGLTATSIYRSLREKKTTRTVITGFDSWLIEAKKNVRGYSRGLDPTPRTPLLIDELVQELNNVAVSVNIKLKRSGK
jgi:hypothetical protein